MSPRRSSMRSTPTKSYTVHEVGAGGVDKVVTGFRAINSAENPQEVIDEIAAANVVTTAVGPTVLRFVAPLHRRRTCAAAIPPRPRCRSWRARTRSTPPTCSEITSATRPPKPGMPLVEPRGVREHRRRPHRPGAAQDDPGVDVTVEPFFEWAIERPPFGDDPPQIPGAHFVDDLAPYIERKLFTVNTGHATTAYFGARRGHRADLGCPRRCPRSRSGSARRWRRHPLCSSRSTNSTRAGSPSTAERILDRFRNPALARHRVAGGPAASPQALTPRALHRPGRRGRRARASDLGARRRDGRRPRVRGRR